MRTTLKRGVGRGATLERQRPGGHAAGAASGRSPSTASRPRRAERPLARARDPRLVGARPRRLVGGTGGRRVPLPPRDGRRRRAALGRGEEGARSRSTSPLPGEPATALVIGYDHRADEGKNTPSRSDTLMLVRADPGEKTISLLSFPRDLNVPIDCPGQAPFVAKINAAYADLRRVGYARDRPRADGAADQLPHHGQLPRLPAARRQARRDLDRRRPPLLQRPRRPDRLREDQPPARLPAAERHAAPSTSSASGTPTRDLYRNARQQQLRPLASRTRSSTRSRSRSCRR